MKAIRCPECHESSAIHRRPDGTIVVYCPFCETIVAVVERRASRET